MGDEVEEVDVEVKVEENRWRLLLLYLAFGGGLSPSCPLELDQSCTKKASLATTTKEL
jgi:hypothetical protein